MKLFYRNVYRCELTGELQRGHVYHVSAQVARRCRARDRRAVGVEAVAHSHRGITTVYFIRDSGATL